MFLTFYYMAATWMQSVRLRSFYERLLTQLDRNLTVVFFNINDEGNGSSFVSTTSELCTNSDKAIIADVLWYQGSQRGAAVFPLQNLFLGRWITFPKAPLLIPFEFNSRNQVKIDETRPIHVLIEAGVVPLFNYDNGIIQVENYGRLLAWKVDSHFAVLLQSDLNHFTELIMYAFMQKCLVINDRLPLIRIETVSIEGEAQPFDVIQTHSRREMFNRAMRTLSITEWEKHLNGLQNLGVLAHQAIEFQYHRNRTEGKTGIIKPDLIPNRSIDGGSQSDDSGTTSDNHAVASTSKLTNNDIVSHKKQESPKKTLTNILSSPKIETKSKLIQSKPETSSVLLPKKESKEEAPVPHQNNDKTPKSSPFKENSKDSQTPHENVKKEANAKDLLSRSSIKRSKAVVGSHKTKPPNVLVYSDSVGTRDNVIKTLHNILDRDMYTIYPLSVNDVKRKVWMDNTTLLIVCGSANTEISKILLDYFVCGGKMLCLCSDVLHVMLPNYRTAEVRENELVQFSYGRWQKIKMMHHIFCYQPSPVKKHFSHDSDEPPTTVPSTSKPLLMYPRSAEVKDLLGETHNLQVQVLGTEETWNTPSLMLAVNPKSGGRAVFSQVHLEIDPQIYETDETKYIVLQQSNSARIEILSDLLSSHLSIVISKIGDRTKNVEFKPAYFLGTYEAKAELIQKLKPKMEIENQISNSNLTMHFVGKNDVIPKASEALLPILVHSCPENFSTVNYFDNLKTEKMGRLLIYAPVVSSSMNILSNLILTHGIAVIPNQQTQGLGRSGNQWLSPRGCAMFSIQLHIPLASPLGQKVSLVQHLMVVAIVSALLKEDGYGNLDIAVKWPNDIYANGVSKIGGLIVNSLIESSQAICNIGVGLNLSNTNPTVCLDDLVHEYNKTSGKKVPYLQYEKIFAIIFSELESLYTRIQAGDLDYFYKLYHKLWLHKDAEVTIIDNNGKQKNAKVLGIDDFGFLLVQPQGQNHPETVHPDGNSFDMLRGLIQPK